jgi:alcohol dehydrogenase YqhD (iron-dependent ADH family)
MSSNSTLERHGAAVNSFRIHTPTQLFFGADMLPRVAEATAALGTKAFLVTGGGTVERLGYLDEVREALAEAGVSVVHFAGVEPNPDATTINRAAAQLREQGADVVIALGGGSSIDAAKAIAALAATDEPDIWPFMLTNERGGQLTAALPIVAIPTTAATASEVTPFAVISSREAAGKSFLMDEFLKPRVAWLNPAYTTGLSPTTTRDGAADILSHVFESYLLGGTSAPLTDRYAESVMATVLETLPVLLANPGDIGARGTLLWASTLALNDYQSAGRTPSGVVLHFIEHGLSAARPELAHGRGMATIYPAYFRWLLANGRAQERFAQLGTRLFGIEGDEATRATGFVEQFEAWLQENGLWQSLGDLGFSEEDYASVAEYVVRTYGDGTQVDALGPLSAAEIAGMFGDTARQTQHQG